MPGEVAHIYKYSIWEEEQHKFKASLGYKGVLGQSGTE